MHTQRPRQWGKRVFELGHFCLLLRQRHEVCNILIQLGQAMKTQLDFCLSWAPFCVVFAWYTSHKRQHKQILSSRSLHPPSPCYHIPFPIPPLETLAKQTMLSGHKTSCAMCEVRFISKSISHLVNDNSNNTSNNNNSSGIGQQTMW